MSETDVPSPTARAGSERRPARRAAGSMRGAHDRRRDRRWCCSPSAPAARCCQPHGERQGARGERRRAGGAVREDHVRRSRRRAARRWRCRARCRASCRRRSRRAPAATSSAGPRTSAAASKKGELLAEIESPEIDQQLSQAVAARQQTAASLALAKSTIERWEALRKKDVGLAAGARRAAQRRCAGERQPRRRRCQRRAAAPAAGLQARRRAVLRRDHAAQRRRRRPDRCGRRRRRAVRADADRSAARLRQRAAVVRAARQAGAEGRRHAVRAARPDLRRRGRAHRRRRSTPATRTMQVEVALPNQDGALLPGAYVQVALPLAASRALVVPTNVLLFRGEGTRVAVVDARARCSCGR